jgi:release factor glutamine methyltransferase
MSDDHSDEATGERSGADGAGRPQLAEDRDVETVYQPAADSQLLAETVLEHAGLDPGTRVLDVGTGSGYVAGRLHEETGANVLGTDVEPTACRAARERGVETVRTDVLAGIGGPVEVVVCNPPYLPTPPEMEWDDPMESALSGGPDGRRVIDPLLADLPRVLGPGGRAYLLISSLTDPDAVRDYAREAGLESTVRARQSHPFERLLVLELHPTG